jgi:hypothetical protein
MPVHKATKNGKSGYQWGQHGKIYTGPGAQAKAAKQGAAAHAAGYKSMQKHTKGRGK